MSAQGCRGNSAILTMAFAALLVTACSASPVKRPLLMPAPGSPIRVEGSPGNVALGDVNQDRNPDVVVVGDRGITVLLGHGDGRFHVAPGSPVAVPERATEMALARLDGDATLDVAVASHDSYGVTLLFGDGKGGFTLAPRSSVVMKEGGDHPHTHGLNIGDVNGDGSLDLVTTNSDDNDVSIAFGDGKGSFARADSSLTVGRSPYPSTLADLDGDGHLDIITTSTSRRNREQEASTRALTVLWGDGHGTFRKGTIPLRTVLPWFVAVADLNGDGVADLVVTHAERRELTVLLGDGKGREVVSPRPTTLDPTMCLRAGPLRRALHSYGSFVCQEIGVQHGNAPREKNLRETSCAPPHDVLR